MVKEYELYSPTLVGRDPDFPQISLCAELAICQVRKNLKAQFSHYL